MQGLDVDQQDLPPRWHLKALAVAAALLGLLYLAAARIFL